MEQTEARYNKLHWRLRQRLKRSKRALVNRRGDGVHSPYAFHFIRHVIRCPHPYNAFPELTKHLMDKAKLRQCYGDRLVTARKQCELIFRAAHHHRGNHAVLVSQGTSILPHYLLATGVVKAIEHVQSVGSLFSIKTIGEVSNADSLSSGVAGACEQSVDSLLSAPLIVLEDADRSLLLRLADCPPPKEAMLIIHTGNPNLRRYTRQLRDALHPTVRFDMQSIEIWVWRRATTPGSYKVYH